MWVADMWVANRKKIINQTISPGSLFLSALLFALDFSVFDTVENVEKCLWILKVYGKESKMGYFHTLWTML